MANRTGDQFDIVLRDQLVGRVVVAKLYQSCGDGRAGGVVVEQVVVAFLSRVHQVQVASRADLRGVVGSQLYLIEFVLIARLYQSERVSSLSIGTHSDCGKSAEGEDYFFHSETKFSV